MGKIDDKLTEELIKHFNSFDINTIPLNERRKQYIDLSSLYMRAKRNKFEDDWDFDDNGNVVDVRTLNESFEDDEQAFISSHTLPNKMLFEGLMNDYRYETWQFETNTDRNVVNAIVSFPRPMGNFGVITANINKNVEIIEKYMDERGYEKFRIRKETDINGMEWVAVLFTTKEQYPFNNYLIENNIEYLVHSAPITKEEHIDDMGVWPHSSAPNAKYFFTDSAFYYTKRRRKGGFSNSYINMMRNLAKKIKHENPTYEFVIYYIKVKDIIDYVTFYRDPNVLGCCYTKSVIAPKYLTDKDYEIYEPI